MPQIQYVKGGPSRSDLSSRLIGESLGEGLSEGLGTYFATKSLDKVLDDPALKDASQQEKMSALQRAMSPHGARGEKLLAQRYALEEQEGKRQKEKITKETEATERKLGDRYLRGEEADISSLPLDKQIGLVKAKGASSPGGVTGQAIPPPIMEQISAVLDENPEGTADEISLEMGKRGIPPIFSNPYIESRRRKDEGDMKLFDSFSDVEKEAIEAARGADRDQLVMDQMDTLIQKDNLTTPVLHAFLESVGLPVGVLGNPDSEQFEKLSQELMKGIQAVYGSRLNIVEVQNYMKGIPDLSNSPEGRRRVVEQWKVLTEGKKAKLDAYKEVSAKYPDKRPKDFRLQVYEAEQSRLDGLSEKFGLVSRGLYAVPQGTPMDDSTIDKYLEAFGRDASRAFSGAQKNGYKI